MKYAYDRSYFQCSGLGDWHRASGPAIAALVTEFLERSPGARDILDMGCGDGFYGKLLSSGAASVDGVDASDYLSSCESRRYYRDFTTADVGSAWVPARAYDLVFSTEVIEHVADHDEFIRNIGRALRPGGQVLLTTTGYAWYLFIYAIAFRRQLSWGGVADYLRGLFDERARTRFLGRFWEYSGGHLHGFSARELSRAFRRNGFDVTSVRHLYVQEVFPVAYFERPPGGEPPTGPRRLFPAVRAIGAAVNRFCEAARILAPNVVIVARKR